MTDNNFCLISDDIDETIARNASGVEIDMAPKIEGSPLSKGIIIYRKGGKQLSLAASPGHYLDALYYHDVVIPRPLSWDTPNETCLIEKQEEKEIIKHLTEALKLIDSRVYFTEMKKISDAERIADLKKQAERINEQIRQEKAEEAVRAKTKKQLKLEARLNRFYIQEEKRAEKNIAKLVKRFEAGKIGTPALYERFIGKLVDLLPS